MALRTLLLAALPCALCRLSVLAVFTALAVCRVQAPAVAAVPVRSGFFGINPGDLFELPESRWDTHLAAIANMGVQVVRMGAWWADVQPGPPVDGRDDYSWADLDKRVAALAHHHLRWEPLLCFSATWGSDVDGDYTASPAGTEHFAAFARALATRYGPGGSFWEAHRTLPPLAVTAYEVWNEENAKLYWHPATPSQYADLYAATRRAIHEVDEKARVVVGGLAAPNHDIALAPQQFLRQMYAQRPGLRGAVDAVGLHPYARTPKGVYASVAAVRKALDAIAGPGLPIEVTEIGWTALDMSESKRAAYLGEVAARLSRSDCGIERLMPYAWLGPERAAGDREQWFGIANQDGTPKESATAYAAVVRGTRGPSRTPRAEGPAICAAPHTVARAPRRPDRHGQMPAATHRPRPQDRPQRAPKQHPRRGPSRRPAPGSPAASRAGQSRDAPGR
jgi:polysaccharide biosynthesis protein PslG